MQPQNFPDLLIWSSHSSCLQISMVLFCFGLCINILARILRPPLSSLPSCLPAYLHCSSSPNGSCPFLLTKTTPCGPIAYLLITQLSLLISFLCFPIPLWRQSPYFAAFLLPWVCTDTSLSLPQWGPPHFNLQPTVMIKYSPLILPSDNFLNQFIPLYLLLKYNSLPPGLHNILYYIYNVFLLVCLPASFLLCNSI